MRIIYLLLLILLMVADADAKVPSNTVRTTDIKDICTTLTSTIRNVPQSVKKAVYKRDGGDLSKSGSYEVDHRISLTVGGTNDINNLKLQSYTGSCNAHHKDKLEVRFHSLVCKGKLSVSDAQDTLYNNWEDGYKKHIDANGCK